MNSIADELGIPHSTFSWWCLQNQKHLTDSFPGHGRISQDQAPIQQLEKELERTHRKRDILKKP